MGEYRSSMAKPRPGSGPAVLPQGQLTGQQLRGVYAYEDCAEHLFLAARDLGLRRVYDLPIAYWETAQRLLREEADRYPEWEPTLLATRDSQEKLSRDRNRNGAGLVICPSRFVLESLPVANKRPDVASSRPFGSPAVGLDPNLIGRFPDGLCVSCSRVPFLSEKD